MELKLLTAVLSAALFLQGCAATEVTQLSANQFILSASAAPACGRLGASRVAVKMAAVEVIRRGYPHGYQRYVILDAASASNVSTTYVPPTTNTYGYTVATGSNDADLRVYMLKPEDRGFANGLDPKAVLGEDWEKLVENGINTCRD